jgi:hypothetical protein
MLLDEKLDGLLKDLNTQWNIAERRIKKAEFVQGGVVVNSAIFELRYAGRKLIDAHALIREKDWKNDSKTYEDICRFLADAIEDCVKAKHDAIDAMVDFVTNWFNELEARVGPEKLVSLFPEYLVTTASIAQIQDKIAQSRENRIAARDGVYDEIEKVEYKSLLDLYDKMRLSRDRIDLIHSSQRRKERSDFYLLFVPAAAAVFLVLLEIYKLIFGH